MKETIELAPAQQGHRAGHRTAVTRACLLGPYPGNTHISINNYFEYCRASIQTHRPGWEFAALRPGRFDEGQFLRSDVGRSRAWKELYLDWPMNVRKLKADVFHIVDQGMAWYRLFLPAGKNKVIVTVHDLINILNIRGRMSIENLPRRRQLLVKLCMNQIQKSDAVICPSLSTALDVVRELEIPSERIHVIHNSIPRVFAPLPEAERRAARTRLFPDASHAILHVGKPTAYKNRIGVLKSFDLIHRALPDSKLVMTAGQLTPDEAAFLNGRPCARSIETRQPEHREGLRELYAAADVFLFPSIFEGFGWPPVEAMACGCPVVSSVAGSLAEVVGEGAVKIENPLDAEAFANAALDLLKDNRAAARWREKGLVNSSRFSEAAIGPQLANLYSSIAA